MIMVWSTTARNHPELSEYGGKWTILKAERTFPVHKCDESFKILVAALVKMLAMLRDVCGPYTIGAKYSAYIPTIVVDIRSDVPSIDIFAPAVCLGFKRFEHYARVAEPLSSYS